MQTTGAGGRPAYGMFLSGVLLGLLLAALVIWRAAAGLQEHGVVVAVNTEQIAGQVRDQIQNGLEDALRAGMGVALRNADVDAIAGRLGDQAYDLVKVQLAQGLNGQRFTVRPWPWFSLPVTLVTQ